MFKREHHRRIHGLLKSLNGSLLEQAQCYFGGGTAIVLLLGEYRESLDVDFLCESTEGYRTLRNTIYNDGLSALFQSDIEQLRETRTDQYGIRTVLNVEGVPIKFEIIKEGRISLAGAINTSLGVPVLTRTDMYVETLLANTDRGADVATLSRDIIDLSMMISEWGEIPEAAWSKAQSAYGDSVKRAFVQAFNRISDADYLQSCARKMAMEPLFVAKVQRVVSDHLRF